EADRSYKLKPIEKTVLDLQISRDEFWERYFILLKIYDFVTYNKVVHFTSKRYTIEVSTRKRFLPRPDYITKYMKERGILKK
ncbi:hypothetical protein OAB57_03665, partial [Bacteriovoracaceae bacterium]|nr:hypothetical protein [Bacteriovoracaceae bacterium]